MQDLITTTEPTMSSREIAELVESPHDAVLKSIRYYISEGVVSGNETPYRHPQNGQMYPCYTLSYRDTMVIASGYSVKLRARIIDRWQELEAQQAPRVPATMAEALRLAADQAEELERQQALLEAQKPAVEFVERYTDSTGLVSLTQAAKDLQFKPRAFTKALELSGYLYRTGGALTPYQRYLDQGLFAMVVGEKGGHGYSQTKITTKGKTHFAQRFATELLA